LTVLWIAQGEHKHDIDYRCQRRFFLLSFFFYFIFCITSSNWFRFA